MASPGRASVDPRRAARAPGRELPGAVAAVNHDGRAFAALLVDYCLEVRAGQQILVRSTTLAAPLLLALQRAVLERDAWPLLRPSLPDRKRSSGPPPATCISTPCRPPISPRPRASTRFCASTRRDEHPRTRRRRPGAPARAARAREPSPRGDAGAAVVRDDLADAGGRAAGGDVDRPTSRRSSPARCSSTATTRSPPGSSCSALQARLIARLSTASELRIEGEGTDLTVDVSGRTWVNSDGRRNMPSGEVFTGPIETSAEGRIHYSIPTSPRGLEVAGISLEFREGVVVSARAERGDEVLQAMLATDDGARAARRDRDRHELRRRPRDRLDAGRREDGRHRPPRARPLVSRDRRHERVGHPLGHDLRPAPGSAG